MIELIFFEIKDGLAFDRGARGILATTKSLTASDLERLREYWKDHARQLEDGEKLTIPPDEKTR